MDVLFVTDLFRPFIGGGEILMEKLANTLVKEGHNATFVTSRLPETEKKEIFGDGPGKAVIKRVYTFPLFKRESFTITGTLKGIFEDCDVIYTQTFVSTGAAWLIKKLKRKPCVITVHALEKKMWGEYFGFFRAIINEFLEQRIIHRNFDFWVPVSLYLRNLLRYEGIPDEKMKLIFNGVDHNLFNSKVSGKKVRKKLGLEKKFIFFYGRPAPEKGFDYFIESAKKLLKRDDVVFGAMLPYQNMHRRYINLLEKTFGRLIQSDIDLEGKVITTKKKNFFIIPPRRQQYVPEIVAASDIVVIPSLSEGFGLTTLEACALGKPVVATNVGAIPEKIFDGETGMLVDPKNSDEIVEKVSFLLENPSVAKRIGRNAAKMSKLFDWKKTIPQYMEVFELLTRK
ncbi:MAG: glycosyltransferase family 4 protein [Asgard group archaeon]